jgi:DNA replication protein DnaC
MIEFVYPKDYEQNNSKILKHIMEDWKKENQFNYLFTGHVGCGKSHLANIIEYNLKKSKRIDSHKKPALQSVRKHYIKYLELLQSGYSDKGDALDRHRRSLTHNEFVIIDDLGDEKPSTDASHDYFSGILEDRYDFICKYEYANTIITTNLDGQNIINLYGSRVYDRLMDKFIIMEFKNESYRAKNFKKIKG